MKTLLKLTSQCDLRLIARAMYPTGRLSLYRTWVEYADDPTTHRLFVARACAHDPHGMTNPIGNDPHSLQALTNIYLASDTCLIIDGIHLLTSNIMLLTNSDEESTEEVATDLLQRELSALQAIAHHPNTIVLSSDIQADHSLSTFQGQTYQRLLALTNYLAGKYFEPDRIYTALSAGLIQEAP